ncbi:hypothetical protein [Flavobacterium alkalisoli]|uniref:hypothetical protein n=1 Tax=Flavobacterium alkalisoli TaxID=2602769 RepID=UPI003A9330D8
MKRFSLFMVVITTFLTSCSTDDTLVSENSSKTFRQKTESNYNEIASLAFNEITDEYILRYGTSEKPVESITEYMLEIAKSNGTFMVLQGSESISCNSGEINDIVNYSRLYVEDLPLSGEALNNIITLFDKLDQRVEEPKRLIGDFSVAVTENPNISEAEKNIMLMASNLALDNNEKGIGDGHDDDWGTSRSVMAASVSGGMESPAKAVMNAVVVTALTN